MAFSIMFMCHRIPLPFFIPLLLKTKGQIVIMGYIACIFLLHTCLRFWPFLHYKLLNFVLSYSITLFYYIIFSLELLEFGGLLPILLYIKTKVIDKSIWSFNAIDVILCLVERLLQMQIKERS